MANAMTYEELMNNEKVQKGMEDFVASVQQDSALMKIIDAAKTVEDMFEITKTFCKVTFEQFKSLFQQAADYLSSDKAVLADEMLDDVVGGWSLSSWFSSNVEKIKCVGAIAGAFVLGATFGVLGGAMIAVGGPLGGFIGVAAAAAGTGLAAKIILDNSAKLQTL